MSIMLPLANMGAFVRAYSQSDLLGKIIILSLISLSIVCWIILIQKTWTTRQVEQISEAFRNAYILNKDRLLHLELDELPKPKNKMIPHPFAAIFRDLKTKSIEILNKNHFFSAQQGASNQDQIYLSLADLEIVESFALTTISAQAKKLEKNLFVLATITTLGPFLGLLGTVWGILISFSELGSGGAAGSNMAVLGGLSTALATTVLGLIIAIPALVAYNYLKNSIRNYSSEMHEFLYELLSLIELQYRKADVQLK